MYVCYAIHYLGLARISCSGNQFNEHKSTNSRVEIDGNLLKRGHCQKSSQPSQENSDLEDSKGNQENNPISSAKMNQPTTTITNTNTNPYVVATDMEDIDILDPVDPNSDPDFDQDVFTDPNPDYDPDFDCEKGERR